MTIYDKVQWHLDGGETREEVLAKFQAVFTFLSDSRMLNEEGQELFAGGIDSSVSLHEGLVNEDGSRFLSQHYDTVINVPADSIYHELNVLLHDNM